MPRDLFRSRPTRTPATGARTTTEGGCTTGQRSPSTPTTSLKAPLDHKASKASKERRARQGRRGHRATPVRKVTRVRKVTPVPRVSPAHPARLVLQGRQEHRGKRGRPERWGR